MSYQIETSPSGVHTTIVTEDHGRKENILSTTDEGGVITPIFRNYSLARDVHKYLETGAAAVRKAQHLHTPTGEKQMTVLVDGTMGLARLCRECHSPFPCSTRILLDEC